MSIFSRFRLRFWPTLGTLVGLILLVGLGTWQYRRHLEKADLEEQREQRLDDAPEEIDSLADFDARARAYSPVVLHGRLDSDHVFLFKHRVHDGEPGYWLGGVLRLGSEDGAVLVNRGWVHREEAERIAEIEPPTEPQRFEGLVHAPPEIIADDEMREALQAGEFDLSDRVTQWESYDLIGIRDHLPFQTPDTPAVVVLGPEHSQEPYPVASYDYVTEPYLTAERHLGYAVFWYVTGLALLAMYLGAAFGLIGATRR